MGDEGVKLSHFRRAHRLGVLFVVKDNEPLDPLHVGLLGPAAEMLEPDYLTDAVEKFRLVRFG